MLKQLACLTFIGLGTGGAMADIRQDCLKLSGEAAVKACDEAIRRNPRVAFLYVKRGLEHEQRGNLDRALADYTKTIDLDPKHSRAYNLRGNVYQAKGEFERALADHSKAIALDLNFAEAYLNRGTDHLYKGDLDRAMADSTTATELDPKAADAYVQRGMVYRAKGDLRPALAEFNKAVEITTAVVVTNMKDAVAYAIRCWARAVPGQDLSLALADCDESIRLAPRYYSLDSRGLVFMKLGRFEEAMADYNAALAISPNFAHALYGRGLAKRGAGDQHGGEEDIATARTLQPWIASLYAAYGMP